MNKMTEKMNKMTEKMNKMTEASASVCLMLATALVNHVSPSQNNVDYSILILEYIQSNMSY